MNRGAYYNEIDPKAAAWLRELIRAGLIAKGDVDERSIEDVKPDELAGYRQCHFFAGIGAWSLALRLAGWPDDRPVWTGSCPCQPFSAAGKGDGFADERHLWPAWQWLIHQCSPSDVYGEQVASRDGLAWLDLVCDDLEAQGYTGWATDLCAAGFGAPHIRQRLWFVAHAADGDGRRRERGAEAGAWQDGERGRRFAGCGDASGLDHPADARRDDQGQHDGGSPLLAARPVESGAAGLVGDAERSRLEGHAGDGDYPRGRSFPLGSVAEAGAVGGFWRGAWVVYCRDGKLRPVEPGTFPLAHGIPARVGRLRGYGNAINVEVAAEFIRASQETEGVR